MRAAATCDVTAVTQSSTGEFNGTKEEDRDLRRINPTLTQRIKKYSIPKLNTSHPQQKKMFSHNIFTQLKKYLYL